MAKPKMRAETMLALNALTAIMNQQRRLSFANQGYGGSDPFADMKHTKAWFDYGYPADIDFYMHWNMFMRNGLAHAGIMVPLSLTWLDKPRVREGEDDEHKPTAWEKDFAKFAKRVKLFKVMRQVDMMQMVGKFSALFFRIKDGKPTDSPVSGTIRPDQIVELLPYWEGQLQINELDENPASERYGRPLTYTYNEAGTGGTNSLSNKAMVIHHSRLITFSEGAIGSSIFGIPANEAGFNALLDWDKIRGSGGEASWLAAANKQILTSDDPNMTIPPKAKEGLNEALKNLKEGLDEALFLKGVKAAPMGATVPNPDIYKQMTLEEYAASRSIPSKILVGTQSGVKAGDEDTAGYMRVIQSRRVNTVSEFIDDVLFWLYRNGTIAEPADGHSIAWPDITAPSAMQKIDYALKMVSANASAIATGELLFTADEVRKEAGFDPLTVEIEMPDETQDDPQDDDDQNV